LEIIIFSFYQAGVVPDGIVLYPHDDANVVITDEDSGDEDNITMNNNLPGVQLRSDVEVIIN
jgi:hypothetical protein